jgi:hypothetical protein
LIDKIAYNSWSDDFIGGKIYTSTGLKKYDTNSNTWAADSNGANMLEIPYASSNGAGVMSSQEKAQLSGLSSLITQGSGGTYSVNAISNAEIDTIVNPSAQSGS